MKQLILTLSTDYNGNDADLDKTMHDEEMRKAFIIWLLRGEESNGTLITWGLKEKKK